MQVPTQFFSLHHLKASRGNGLLLQEPQICADGEEQAEVQGNQKDVWRDIDAFDQGLGTVAVDNLCG